MIQPKAVLTPLVKTVLSSDHELRANSTPRSDDLPDLISFLLYSPNIDQVLDDGLRFKCVTKLNALDQLGHGRNEQHNAIFHNVLYQIYTANFALPWEHATINVHHPFILDLERRMEQAWDSYMLTLHAEILKRLPTIDEFAEWAPKLVRQDKSNMFHSLFNFLSDEAGKDQLREFLYQETPFDIFFSDILSLMIPGIYGALKSELASNFWDEMGKGKEEHTHRNLRLKMMRHFGISERAHLDRVETYCWEELALANLYFAVALDRNKLGQAIGAMLATETAVPGRMERQLNGWRRVGVPDEVLTYVMEHITVDEHHSRGWMNKVVMPLLRQHPLLMHDVVFGIVCRLTAAGAVCDRMLSHLKVRGVR
jgi:hypothetical protein